MINLPQEIIDYKIYKDLNGKKKRELFSLNIQDAYCFFNINDSKAADKVEKSSIEQRLRKCIKFASSLCNIVFFISAGLVVSNWELHFGKTDILPRGINAIPTVSFLVAFYLMNQVLLKLNYSIAVVTVVITAIFSLRPYFFPYDNFLLFGLVGMCLPIYMLFFNKVLARFLILFFSKRNEAFFISVIGHTIKFRRRND